MSRTIVACEELQTIVEEIKSMDECRHLCNDVCCNEYCDESGQFVDHELCNMTCKHFTKEDGIIYD